MNDQEEYDNLITLKREYKKKLKEIKQKISEHPVTKKKNIESGIKALKCLTRNDEDCDEDEIDENIFLNYIENTEHGIEEFRAGAICTCDFYCINDFIFEITIDIHHCHEEYEVSISITNKKLQINKNYNNIFQDADYNYDAFVKEFGIDSVEFKMFKPFFKIDDGSAYYYVM
jgi:hypothetical protein